MRRHAQWTLVVASLLFVARVASGQCPDCHVVIESDAPCEFVGVPCTLTFHLEGGAGCFAVGWGKTGTLPPGLTFANLGADATVSGVPTTPGSFFCTVSAHLGREPFCNYHHWLSLGIDEPLEPRSMAVDANVVMGSRSNANGVLEAGETVQVAPSWENFMNAPQAFTGTTSNFTGPAGGTYTLNDDSADYGTVAAGATGDCSSATGNCYLVTVSGARPAAHWDATFTELLSFDSITEAWTLHVGESFPDVPTSNPSYAYVENLFHNGVTAGCAGGNYCPDNDVTRAQMAVFLLRAKHGSTYVPPTCTGIFDDVPCPSLFADWIEELDAEAITAGCGGKDYCPAALVTRGQMAELLLKGAHDPGYSPPPCGVTIFNDVPCPAGQFVDFINELANEGLTSGCGNGDYCPNDPVKRARMAVFLVKTFGLQLYGP